MDERTKALEEAREHAAREPLATLLRMREDLEKAGKRKLADTLAFLAEHVFEPRVNADFAAKAVGSTAKAVSPRLREETGRSLSTLIADVRGQTALNWMAADPDVSDDTVAEMTGLSRYRLDKLLEKLADQGRPRPRTAGRFDPKSPETWKRALRGQLPAHQVRKLVAHLRAHCPDAFADDADEPTVGHGGRMVPVELAVAEQIWEVLSRLSSGARRELVEQYGFASRTFFDLLVRESRKAGRRDPRQGVDLAELAVLSVEVSADLLGETAEELKAEGRARLDDARRLALA